MLLLEFYVYICATNKFIVYMKKLSLLIGGLLFSGLMMAQTGEQKGMITIEGQTNIGGVVIGEKLAPSLRFRYFATEKLALRATFGMENTNSTSTFTSLPNNTGAEGTYMAKSTVWNLAIGAEYHVAGTDKISPFIAFDVVYGAGKNIIDAENATSSAYQANYKRDTESPVKRIGAALMGGMDYNFSSAFYLGGEIGVQVTSMTRGAGETVTTSNGVTVTTTTNEQKLGTATDLIAALRLGFRF